MLAVELSAGQQPVFLATNKTPRDAEGMKFQSAMNRIGKSQLETVARRVRLPDQKEGVPAFSGKRDPGW